MGEGDMDMSRAMHTSFAYHMCCSLHRIFWVMHEYILCDLTILSRLCQAMQPLQCDGHMRFPTFHFGEAIALGLSMLCMSTVPVFADGLVNISNCTQLQAINDNLNISYRLTASFSCEGVEFAPIGDFGSPFAGSFNGQNYTVSDLTIVGGSTDNIGIFGATDAATIQNLRLDNIHISGRDDVGGLVGFANTDTTITNIRARDLTVSGRDYQGGIVGFLLESTMSGSYVMSGSLAGRYEVGGLLGRMRDSTAMNIAYAGTVDADTWAGGLAGNLFTIYGPNTVTNAYADATITGIDQTGGLFGTMFNDGASNSCILTNGFFSGSIHGGESSIGSLTWYKGEGCSIVNSAYNNTLSTPDTCVHFDDTSEETDCTIIDDDASFFSYKTHEPLASWDFERVWKTTGTFPDFIGDTDTTAPDAPGSFTATTADNDITLRWALPANGDFASFMIRRSLSGYPATVEDGEEVRSGTSGTSFVDTDRGYGTYYYSFFSYDETGNLADGTPLLVSLSGPSQVAGNGGSGGGSRRASSPTGSQTTTHPAATGTPNKTESMSQDLQLRTCERVRKWFANDAKMLTRVNDRLLKRFGFTCSR